MQKSRVHLIISGNTCKIFDECVLVELVVNIGEIEGNILSNEIKNSLIRIPIFLSLWRWLFSHYKFGKISINALLFTAYHINEMPNGRVLASEGRLNSPHTGL